MSSERNCESRETRRYGWCPQDPRGPDHLAFSRWICETLGQKAGEWWLKEIDRLDNRQETLGASGMHRLIQQICKYDCPELIELLYPRWPELFQEADGEGRSALDLCAYHGSAASLWTLLELGADPNGLDRRRLCHFITASDSGNLTLFWLTPLDLARLNDHEDCALLLESYGGRTGAELSQTPPEELPESSYEMSAGNWRVLQEIGESCVLIW